jgi:hypothetical protein
MNLLSEIIPHISREEEFVLCYARALLNGPACARIDRLITEPLKWQRISELASQHRVGPLLYKHLKHDPQRPPIPAAVWKAIEGHAFSVAARNANCAKELARIIKLLRNENIGAMPFKGPVLAAHAYENLSVREFSDLDLLVRPEDLLRTKLLLVHHGFSSPSSESSEHIDLQVGCEFISADKEIRVEMHSLLGDAMFGEKTDLDAVWKRAVWVDVGDFPVRTLARQDLLPHLCAHGAMHHWAKLLRIVDVAETIRVEKDIDWTGLLAESRANGARRVLALGLYLAYGLLDAPVPRSVVNEVTTPEIQELAQAVGSWLFNEENRPSVGAVEETRFFLKVLERVSDRLAFSTQFLKRKLLPKRKS